MNNELGITNNGKKRSFHLSFLFLFFILYSSQAFAEGASLAITPQVITLQTQAPAFIEKSFSIQNKANTPIDLLVTYMPFTQKGGKDGIPFYHVDTNAFFAKDRDIFKKVQLFDGDTAINQLSLSPKQEKKLRLQIILPKDEPDSDYYFSILFISKNPASSGTIQSQSIKAATTITPGIAANILLSIVSGQKQPEGLIQDYTTPFFVTQGPVSITLTFENTGSFLVAPEGTVLISNMFGQIVGKIIIPKTQVLAHTKRHIPISWNESFLLGPYQATLYLNFADDPHTSYKRITTFVGIPIYLLGSIIAVIIFVFLLWSRIRKYQI